MAYTPCRERVFPLELAHEFKQCYAHYTHWLRHLLDRLGREPTFKVWHHAFQDEDDALLQEILSEGWQASKNEAVNVESQVAGILAELFPFPIETVSADEAKEVIDKSPPFPQIRQHLPSLNVMKQVTAYERLHLFRGGLSSLAESLIELYGKQGEYIAYDAMLSKVASRQQTEMRVADFLSLFTTEPAEPNRITAGLDYEIVRASEREVVLHVKECEWVRYYQEHYSQVGYLMACSMDEAEYRSANPRIRMQRTSTLMEGGEVCDFRIYALEEGADPE